MSGLIHYETRAMFSFVTNTNQYMNKLGKFEEHYVQVLNLDINNIASSIQSAKSLTLELTALRTNQRTQIVVSKHNAPLIFEEVKEQFLLNNFSIAPASIQLNSYIIMGQIIPTNAPFIFEDGYISKL
jgi:hypothetical protein